MSIEERGLGIRNLRIFNIALLGKWKWKVKIGKRDIWLHALLNIYGITNEVLSPCSNGVSNWWKGICQLYLGVCIILNEYLMKDAYKSLLLDEHSSSSHS